MAKSSFWDDLGNALTRKAKGLSSKAENLYEIQKIRNKLSAQERMTEKLMMDIGKMIYTRYEHGEAVDGEVGAICEEITFDKMVLPFFTTEAAVSSQELSIARINVSFIFYSSFFKIQLYTLSIFSRERIWKNLADFIHKFVRSDKRRTVMCQPHFLYFCITSQDCCLAESHMPLSALSSSPYIPSQINRSDSFALRRIDSVGLVSVV